MLHLHRPVYATGKRERYRVRERKMARIKIGAQRGQRVVTNPETRFHAHKMFVIMKRKTRFFPIFFLPISSVPWPPCRFGTPAIIYDVRRSGRRYCNDRGDNDTDDFNNTRDFVMIIYINKYIHVYASAPRRYIQRSANPEIIDGGRCGFWLMAAASSSDSWGRISFASKMARRDHKQNPSRSFNKFLSEILREIQNALRTMKCWNFSRTKFNCISKIYEQNIKPLLT